MSGRPSSSGTQSKLKQIVIDFANRVQNVEPDQRILETRNLLCHLVSRYLLNIEEVSTQLAKKTGISSQPETLLSFMQHLVSDQPECFVPETFEAIDVTSKAFIKWITCKLMHLLASSDCQKLHSTSSQIIISILKLIELKDLIFFREIIEEFVMILMSLSNTEFTDLDLQNAVEINCFVLEDSELNSITFMKTSGDEDFSHKPIKISSPNNFFSLQLHITKMLLDVCDCICQFVLDCGIELWPILIYQLDTGTIEIKNVTVRLCSALIDNNIIPKPTLCEYFINCVLALLNFALYSHANSISSGLELSIDSCFNVLLPYNTSAGIVQATPLMEEFKISREYIEQILTGVVTLLNLHTNFCIRDQKSLAVPVCHALYSIGCYEALQRRKNNQTCLIGFTSEVLNWLISQIGSDCNQQPLLGPLSQWSWLEISYQDNLNKLPQTISHGLDAEDQPSPKKAKLDDSVVKNVNASSTGDVTDNLNYDSVAFAMMSKRYFDLCSLLSKSFEGLDVLEIVQTMEGIRICIETFARCNIMVLLLSPSTRNTSSISYGCAKGSQYMSQNLNSDNVLQGSSEIVNPESGINLSLYAIKNSWFNSDQLSLLYTTWKNILLRLKSIVEDELELVVNLEAVYKIIINSAGAILNLCYPSEVLTLSDDLLYYLTNLVSLPWIHEINQDCIDMIIDNDIKSISTAIAKYLDDSKCGSIHNLALLPHGVAPSFRMEVFKKCLLPSNNESLRIAAVKSVPQFLTNLGVQYYHEIISYLSNILDTDSCSIKETVASCIGSIACALSQSPKLQWSSNISFDSTIADGTTLHCSYCQKLIEDSYSSAERGSAVLCADAEILLPFMKLLDVKCSRSIKLAFMNSIPRLISHLDIAALNSDSYSLAKSIMGLVDDPDHEVRLIFSYLVRFLLYETSPPTEDLLGSIQNNFAATPVNSLNGYVVSKIKSVLSKALKESNHSLLETIYLTIGQIGRIAEGELLLVVVIALLEGLLSTYGAVVAVTFDQIRLVAKSKALSPEKLFNRFKEKLCEVLVDNIHDNSLEAKQAIETSIGEVVRVFAFKDIGTFLKNFLYLLLPRLTSKASKTASGLLREIATALNMDYYLMYVDNFPYVATFLITNCNSEIQEKAFHFVEEESTVDLFGLLKSSSQKLLGQLLLYLGSHFTEVFNGLLMLAGWDETFKCEFADPEKAVADYLQPKLLGILTFFNSSLLRAADAEEKKRTLESLIHLMELMGVKYITAVRVKIMAILRASLQLREEKLLRLACRAWNSFVKSVELSSLGPMLSQIIAILYPVMKKYAEFVSPVLDYLIVDNRSQLKEYFREIPFIPDVPQLLKANNVLKEELERANSGEIGPKEKLSQIMKGVCHESADVRLHALSNLRRVLYDLQSQIHEYVLSSEKTDPIVTEIVNELLRRCRLASSKERNLCGECLGIIGAIDPGRLEKVSELSSFGRKFLESDCDSLDFAFELINELARGFLAAPDTRSQDCYAYAIQEILKSFDCASTNETSFGQRLWKMFPENVQEILRPHLHSRYTTGASTDWSTVQLPIFRSKKGSNFKDWVSSWTAYLISKIKKKKSSNIFTPCILLLKHDSNMGLFLLPHALIHALLDSSTKDVNEIRQEILTVMEDVNKESVHDASDFSQICAQAIFSALDHLTHWTFRQIRKAALAAKNKKEKDDSALPVVNHEDVSNFLKSIPQDILANASYKCRANARALMHFETFARNNPDDLQRNLRFLQEIYVALDEPDGVAGVAAVSDDRNSFNKQVLEFESIGNLRDASACYECAIQLEPNELNHHKGLLQCLMGLGQLSTALAHVNGVISQQETWVSALNTYRVEASWRLANWDCLQDYLGSDQDSNDWNVGLGRLLLNARDRNHEEFGKQLKIVRKGLMESFSASIMESGSLQQGYDSLVRLHMLHEVEDCVRLFLGISISNFRKIDEQVLLTNWNSRLQITQHSFKIREPLLNLRRVLLGFGNSSQQLKEQQGSCWLLSAKEARKAGYIQTAFSSLLNPCSFNLSGYHIEKAKLLWKQGGCSQALKCLKDAFSDKNIRINEGGMIDWGDKDGSFPSEEKVGHAKALLLVARWTEDTSHSNSHAVLKQYKNITEIRNQWELGHFYLAKYYDRFMKYVPDNKPARMLEFIPHVIKHYALSLQFGNKFIYESMPRLLTLWLDIGSKFSVNRVKSIDKTFLAVLSDVNKIISDSIEKLPPYKFFTAFSQLISRICHPNASIFDILEKIIAKLMVEYPQQSIWLMAAVSKSSYSVRRSRCHEIFAKAKSNCAELEKFINDATCLFDRLLDVCNMPVSRNCTTISLSENCRSLVRLTNDPSFSAIICPLQSSMTAILSSKIDSQTGPFPDNLPTIVRFKDKIDVLMSLQKPKKIVIRGSDGKEYMMMCKPKDDLRKDSRLMEFNSLINKYLHKDADARRRTLHIRTYAVVPLNEECGILEWVNNTAGLRHILLQLYKEKGILCTGRELKNLDANADKYGGKLKLFLTELLPRHPPVFHEWFLRTFTDSISWYQSRLAYARTVAVMSVVGYVLGLGDRHGENILFDSTSGDAVHVDFSCLFNKGKTFDCPEVVPFRLTHNMIDAMGPTGYEGIYRRACEVTMRVMRNQCDPLMTVLKTFVHDPLVEWGKIRRNDSNRDHAEITNELALKIVKDVEDRLKGNTSKSKGPALSVEGQVHELVKEATDVNNLSQMYIGWAAYM